MIECIQPRRGDAADPYGGIVFGDVDVDSWYARTEPDTEDDRAAWDEYLRRWELSGPLPLVKLYASLCPVSGHLFIVAEFLTNDRDDLRERIISGTKYAPTRRPDDGTARWLRAFLLGFYAHELDEFLKLDGERLLEHHKTITVRAPAFESADAPL